MIFTTALNRPKLIANLNFKRRENIRDNALFSSLLCRTKVCQHLQATKTFAIQSLKIAFDAIRKVMVSRWSSSEAT
jgi:hypothetical protein